MFVFRKHFIQALLITIIALAASFFSLAQADIPNTNKPTTFTGPITQMEITNPLSDVAAYSILGEAGINNLRLGGTVGWQFLDDDRIKISMEYLRQDLGYAFFDGTTHQWMSQKP